MSRQGFGQIRTLGQHIQKCERCEQYRHVTQFREFALWCMPCEAEDALDREIAQADDKDIDAARDVVNIILHGKKTFDVGKSYKVKERIEAFQRDERIVLWAEIIMDGKRPGVVPRKAWRVIQQRAAGKSYDDIAAEEDMLRPEVAKLEGIGMRKVVDYATKIVDDRRAPIHVPADHPRYDFLMKGLDLPTDDGVHEVVNGDGGGIDGVSIPVEPGSSEEVDLITWEILTDVLGGEDVLPADPEGV